MVAQTQNKIIMKRYIITIVDIKTNTVHNLERDEHTINSTMEKEFGGWGRFKAASTGNIKIDDFNFQQAGTIFINGSYKLVSILAYKKESEEAVDTM